MSKQQLTIEHFAPYLPYGLEIYLFERRYTITGVTQETLFTKQGAVLNYENSDSEIKILLRPLSDLTKEIEHNGEKLIPWRELEFGIDKDLDMEIIVGDSEYLYLSYIGLRNEMQKLFEWRFDVFGLIEKGLAININDLKDEKRNKI